MFAARLKSIGRLSAAQERSMRWLGDGLSIDHGITGNSAYGGLQLTIHSLYRRGLIDERCELTKFGRAWVAAQRSEVTGEGVEHG